MTPEQVRMLAEAERGMDAGKLPYVVSSGERLLVDPLVMDEFGLEIGQTVSNAIVIAILEASIAMCDTAIEARAEQGGK